MANESATSRPSGYGAATSPTNASPGPELKSQLVAGAPEEELIGAHDREATFQINDFEKLQSAYANQASLFDEATERRGINKQQSHWATIYDAIKLNPRWQKMQQCISQVQDHRGSYDYNSKKKEYEEFLMNRVRALK